MACINSCSVPWIVRQVAGELLIRGKLGGYFDKLELPELKADYSVLYNSIGIPTVIIQKDCVAVYAKFVCFSEQKLPAESWVSILAYSIK